MANAQPSSDQLKVTGMTCANCARHVSDAIQTVPGVASARVTLEEGRASVRWAADHPQDIQAVIQAVRKAGFDASTALPAPPATGSSQLWGLNVLTGIVPTVLLMTGVWGFNWEGHAWFRITSLLLAAIVQFGPGRRFYQGAWRALKTGHSNMDTLVSLGSTTAFTYSAWILLNGLPHHLYFMEAATIITLISIGHWLEARTGARASSTLKNLLTLTAPTARLAGQDGQEKVVPLAEVEAGDQLLLKPGDRVPCDGIVLEGDSAVDESMLTGESIPVDKQSQSPLHAGTVNLNGRLRMKVTTTGDATALAQIIAAVERAQSSRANIQRLADRVSNIFVPLIILIAIATALWWGLAPDRAQDLTLSIAPYLWPPHIPATPLAAAIITAVAVLIIACPCAMGLATPAAIMAGTNAAAQRGILIRDAIALEKAGRVTAVLFDKTGTLTNGRPTVVAQQNLGPPAAINVQTLAASLGRHSTHPLSRAVAALDDSDIALRKWKEVRGGGVEAELLAAPNQECRLGSLRWIREAGVDTAAAAPFLDQWGSRGTTVVAVAIDNQLCGLIALEDTLKSGARNVIRQITAQGMSTWLVTGDNRSTALQIATRCGIPPANVFSEVKPQDKAGLVEKLQRQGEKVAFVGDGINDAPALEQADLGIAVNGASDIACESADMILLNSGMNAVPESLGMARATLRTIKQNLFWAFCYNALAVPVAALGFMSPVLCAATMGLSDIIVIGNSLRLRHWRLPH